MANRPVREAIREVDNNSWLIGDRLLLSRASRSNCMWSDGKDAGFVISEATFPLPESRPLPDTSEIKKVYDAGDGSAVFDIGDAFCKVRIMEVPETTREHDTIAWLQKRSWSFAIPRVLFHAEFDGRYYIVLSRVAGATIDSVWPTLDEPTKERYAERMVEVCKEMAAVPVEGSAITGIDGNALTEYYLRGKDKDCSPEGLRKSCMEIGMDCSKLVFYHCDLGPTNVMIDVSNDSFGVIDWETAGFVPLEWVRTKFRVSSGMDLNSGDGQDWRKRVQLHMEHWGFTDVAYKFMAWMDGTSG